jgi:hypothetical protein
MRTLLCLLAIGCGNSVPGPSSTTPDMAQTPTTLPDLSLPPQGCICTAGNYCDIASNTCKPGCAFNNDCTSGHCDMTTHMCFTPGPTCGTTTCQQGQQCCLIGGTPTCAASCIMDMGTVTIMCQGSSDCTSGSAPICCAHITLATGSCAYAATVMCEASCAFQAPLGCGSSGQGQVCTAKANCLDPSAANCCTFSFGGQSASFCVNDTYKNFSSGCLP